MRTPAVFEIRISFLRPKNASFSFIEAKKNKLLFWCWNIKLALFFIRADKCRITNAISCCKERADSDNFSADHLPFPAYQLLKAATSREQTIPRKWNHFSSKSFEATWEQNVESCLGNLSTKNRLTDRFYFLDRTECPGKSLFCRKTCHRTCFLSFNRQAFFRPVFQIDRQNRINIDPPTQNMHPFEQRKF